ncbi:MAG: endonuclease/exonuclease/phosphatase family protein [bacterium]
MKIISYNVWGGKMLDPLLKFIDEESKNTDIFCFQEVLDSSAPMEEDVEDRHHLLEIFKAKLPEFNYYFSPFRGGYDCSANVDSRVSFGLAIFIRKTFKIDSFEMAFLQGDEMSPPGSNLVLLPYSAQFLKFLDNSGRKVTLAHVHGICDWPKTDTPARIRQSEIINEFLAKKNTSEIICGDFNLLPETESIALIEKNRVGLIKEFGIQNTRNSLVPTPHVSDYFFVSSDLKVEDFSVSKLFASDHLPLILAVN